MHRRFIFIYGPPGSGKTTLGRRLARSLELPFFDLDDVIASHAGQSIPDIFAAEGEAGFRRRESAALESVIKQMPGVVALGGGALLNSENRRQVETAGRVLCLDAGFETILSRLESQSGRRPLLDGDAQERLRLLLGERAEHYGSFSLRLDTSGLSLEQAAWEAQITLGRYRVTGMDSPYDVHILSGGLESLGEVLRYRGLRGPLALVSDANVAALHAGAVKQVLENAGFEVHPVVIPAGEEHKTIDTVCSLWESFLQARLDRYSTVVALGGGVVGDLAGFAAATFLRGVPWVVAPTSLLSMVDASLGGKTGADLPQGKNLIGAFNPPALVVADPRVLDTLPPAELRNGLAEVVKHGVLGDPYLFALCRQDWDSVLAQRDEIVRRAVAVKVRVILSDPYEGGERASLNLGHTLGHALEIASGFRLKHGEAVAIGMVQAARLAERRSLAAPGLAQEIETALSGLGLPTALPDGLDRERVLAAIGLDKKRAGGMARAVLPVRIGVVRWGIPLEDPSELLQ